jgi:CheY-like chemotaxis protein
VPRDGTVFSIYLPTYAREEWLPANSDLINPSRQGGQGVLLLGIEPAVQPFISKTLESLGHHSRAVFDARQAGELLAQESTRWSIVLVEGDNLGSKSDATCEQLAALYPRAKVICVCSQHNQVQADTVHGAEGSEPCEVYHLEKPITVWGLEEALKRVQGVSDSKAAESVQARRE